ncbi:hypothetical protein SEA_CICADA_52 [Microbacterium phage Cicada]|nr:hypothetical protein SEA_CICADA_52 [Microbacterium phage Cicada]
MTPRHGARARRRTALLRSMGACPRDAPQRAYTWASYPRTPSTPSGTPEERERKTLNTLSLSSIYQLSSRPLAETSSRQLLDHPSLCYALCYTHPA